MPLREVSYFPLKWLDIFHCCQYHQYSNIDDTVVNYSISPNLTFKSKKEFNNLRELILDEKQIVCISPDHHHIKKPYKLFVSDKDGSFCIVQWIQNGHIFLLSDGNIFAGCKSCDGATISNFSLYECENFHDLIYYGLTDKERLLLFNINYFPFPSYPDFLSISSNLIFDIVSNGFYSW